MSKRASGFKHAEDILLCQVYMEISQDPIVGVYQSGDRLWSRVEDGFNKGRKEDWEIRTKRSMQARIGLLEKAAKKLHGCIRTVRGLNQSGASNEDIIQQAKLLFAEDPAFKSGWKYDHVWRIIKDFEKFQDGSTSTKRQSFASHSSESENPTPEFAQQASSGINAFSLSLDDDDDNVFSGSQSERPMGVKKAKLKRKKDEDMTSLIKTVQDGNKQLLEELKRTNSQMNYHLEIQNKNYLLKETKEENKILFRDLNSIQDPRVRAIVEVEQKRIIEKRAAQLGQPNPFPTTSFDQYLNNCGGSGSDGLPDY